MFRSSSARSRVLVPTEARAISREVPIKFRCIFRESSERVSTVPVPLAGSEIVSGRCRSEFRKSSERVRASAVQLRALGPTEFRASDVPIKFRACYGHSSGLVPSVFGASAPINCPVKFPVALLSISEQVRSDFSEFRAGSRVFTSAPQWCSNLVPRDFARWF